jgi:hypothetical protein
VKTMMQDVYTADIRGIRMEPGRGDEDVGRGDTGAGRPRRMVSVRVRRKNVVMSGVGTASGGGCGGFGREVRFAFVRRRGWEYVRSKLRRASRRLWRMMG